MSAVRIHKRIKKDCSFLGSKGECYGFNKEHRKYMGRCKVKNCPRIQYHLRKENINDGLVSPVQKMVL